MLLDCRRRPQVPERGASRPGGQEHPCRLRSPHQFSGCSSSLFPSHLPATWGWSSPPRDREPHALWLHQRRPQQRQHVGALWLSVPRAHVPPRLPACPRAVSELGQGEGRASAGPGPFPAQRRGPTCPFLGRAASSLAEGGLQPSRAHGLRPLPVGPTHASNSSSLFLVTELKEN